ncbi:MAG TPA: T9SS type A sorting domain-containing protein [Candidatus Kapabacteria bacterium]|nr:T9SS type A sorting domain-containing protein [Candidatus Kapabacteria bacterium]
MRFAVTAGNGRISVHYRLPRPTHVRIDIVDILGRTVATLTNDERNEGEHTAWINEEVLPPGTHICHLIVSDQTQTKRIAC